MDFSLSDDQRAIVDAAAAFAAAELAPHAARWDEEKHFPVDVLRQAAALGFAGVYVGEDVGGSGLGRLDATLIFEALAYGDTAVTAFLTIHNMCAWMIDSFGSEALRRRYLPGLTSMELIASYCLTEPGSGSDAAALRTTARRDGDHYVVNGSKAFISGAGTSDVYVVMVRTGGEGPRGVSTLIVEKDAPGLSFGAQERKMGWNAQPTAQVNFDNVRVPVENRVGAEGDGFRFAMMGLDGGRLNIAACSLGGAGFALDTAKAYMEVRNQFGRPLKDFQALQFRIADMATELDAARLMTRRAADALDKRDPEATKYAAMAKRFATDAGFEVANQALQLHGGYGYLKDYPLERIVRDLRGPPDPGGHQRDHAGDHQPGDVPPMTRIAFIGVGNMGCGMAANLVKSGAEVTAFDLSKAALDKASAAGCALATSAADAVRRADVVITMLPAGQHVRAVYGDDIIPNAPREALLIDCSTIDVDSARAVAAQAAEAGFHAADAPVSGGIMAADAGTLAFMVGCEDADFGRIETVLGPMARAVVRAGGAGAGQAGEDLQQHAARHLDDRDLRGPCARREARPRSGPFL